MTQTKMTQNTPKTTTNKQLNNQATCAVRVNMNVQIVVIMLSGKNPTTNNSALQLKDSC